MLEVKKRKSREIKKVYRTGNSLFLEQESGIIRLVPQTAGIIRVSYTESGAFPVRQGEAFEDLSGSVPWEYGEEGQDIWIRTGFLTVKIDRMSGSVRYEDKDGRLLLREALQESKTVEAFDSYRTVAGGKAKVEEITTPDGVKRRIREAEREFDRKLYHTKASFDFAGDEVLYGLGQAEEGIWNLRHTTQYLHQANLKIAIPMLLSGRGYGILLSTQGPAIFEDTQYGSCLYTEADEYLDYFFLAGNMEEVVRGYRRLTGQAAMLPKWVFGYLQSRERYETADEIVHTAEKFREAAFPVDGIILDWMSWKGNLWGQKTFDEERFPDPGEMIRTLHGMDVHFMLSIWPHMDEKSENYRELAEAGLLLPNSNIFNAFCREGREMYWRQAERGLFRHGVDAWWTDSSEPVTPEWERMRKPPAGEMYRNFVEEAGKVMPLEKANAFGLYHSKGIYEGQRSVTQEKRVVNLTRSGYAGSQKYGAILWSGDISASWETLKRQVAAGLQFCASGLPYWTLDIGAFFVKRGEQWYWNGDYDHGLADLGYRELYVRWFQYGAFLPIFRSHGTDCAREPWQFGKPGEPFYDALYNAAQLRYRLLPYIYSLAGAVWRKDSLIMRPLLYDFPEDAKAAETSGQYMFGPALMICPVTEPILYRKNSVPVDVSSGGWKVYLPEGTDWYDFHTGQRYTGGQEITVELSLERIPVFAKAGAVIPTMEPGESTACMEGRDICLWVYAGADGSFELYEDSGDGYGYEQGEYCVTTVSYYDREQKTRWQTKGDARYRLGEISVRYFSTATVSSFHNDGGRGDRIFEFKLATADDIEQLVKTRMIVLRAANQLSEDAELPEVERESREYYMQAVKTGEHIAYLVYDKEKVIGAGGVSFYQVLPTCHNPSGKKAYIMNMYTAAEYRRQGIARRTLDILVKAARDRGIMHIGLEATAMGRPLYEKYGFVSMEAEMELPIANL